MRRGLGLLDTQADFVLGQVDFTHRGANILDERAVAFPGGVATDVAVEPYRLYIADTQNNRVLGYADPDSYYVGAPADLVLGQPDFASGDCDDPSSKTLCQPTGLAVQSGGGLWVADTGHNRVVLFDSPFETDAAMDTEIGQPNFASGECAAGPGGMCAPMGLAVDGAKLFVADSENNRVLQFALPPSSGDAILAFGQANLDGNACAITQAGLCKPTAVAASGRLYVADTGANRVVSYAPTEASGRPYDLVIGQADATHAGCNRGADAPSASTLCTPAGLALDGSDLYVADVRNQRVLFFSSPKATDTVADRVYGQLGFDAKACNRSAEGADTDRLCFYPPPERLAFWPFYFGDNLALDPSGGLWVADTANSRALHFPFTAGDTALPGDKILGQFGFTADAPNGANAQSLMQPAAVAVDTSVSPPHVYVADMFNHRVLGFRDASQLASGADADLVLGQDSNTATIAGIGNYVAKDSLSRPTSLAVDGEGNLWVADFDANRVVRFNLPFEEDGNADLVLGQASLVAGECGHADPVLCAPLAVAVGPTGRVYVGAKLAMGQSRVSEFVPPFTDGMAPARTFGRDATKAFGMAEGLALSPAGDLYVADQGTSQVVAFAGDGEGPTGDTPARVLGQATTDEIKCNRGSSAAPDTLCEPGSLALSADGTLYVADRGNNRVLGFLDVAGKATGDRADLVIGQPRLDVAICNASGIGPDTLCGAFGVAVDRGGTLFVGDTGNNRVTIYSANLPPTIAPIADQTVVAGHELDLTIHSADPNGDVLRLSADGLPPTLALADDGVGGGTVVGSPTEAGSFPITITAADTGVPRLSATVSFMLTVELPPPPDAGPPGDAGADDAGLSHDGGGGGDEDTDGCGCRAAGRRGGDHLLLGLAMLAIATWLRRR